ncbi:GntR family transcriptional regulator [Methylobacterium nodulans]|uniref:Transcriptional regulator, GntR family n=1 Tax=Methylobacterium nodulans (strain LMG 21967 / CNCM I-2342 / ORS 2060) TaxID=460265 RepID=B8INC7_METNO|nr:GntR family transcriptional regulator [Methylobacterium nodulans]ACL56453.1 transcriptional regulator, GntR family [Methylobacterium nodulans ORS 2060]
MTKARAERTTSLAQHVADELRKAIVSAQFDFGEALSEEGLAAAFGVSRTPIREALTILQAEGLVTIVPKSGTYIFTPSEDDVAELCEHRVTLEVEAVKRTLQRGREAALAELRLAFADMTRARATEDMELYGRADTAFHLSFFHHCGNRYLRDAYERNLGRVSALRTHLAFVAVNEPERSYADHERIIALISANEPEQLADLLEQHILRTRENYLSALRGRLQVGELNRVARIRRKLGHANGTFGRSVQAVEEQASAPRDAPPRRSAV